MIGRISMVFGARRNIIDGGNCRIRVASQDQHLAVYGHRRVRLLDRPSMRLIQEIITDSNGNGSFNWIAARDQGYTVIACNNRRSDGLPDYPSIADFVTPEPMP